MASSATRKNTVTVKSEKISFTPHPELLAALKQFQMTEFPGFDLNDTAWMICVLGLASLEALLNVRVALNDHFRKEGITGDAQAQALNDLLMHSAMRMHSGKVVV